MAENVFIEELIVKLFAMMVRTLSLDNIEPIYIARGHDLLHTEHVMLVSFILKIQTPGTIDSKSLITFRACCCYQTKIAIISKIETNK